MPRMFTLMVVGQNIIKFGGLFLALAGLFILIGLKLAAPVLSAFGFDEKFAASDFLPVLLGRSDVFPGFSHRQGGHALCRLRNRANRAFDLQRRNGFHARPKRRRKSSRAARMTRRAVRLIVTLFFFVSCLCYILVPWLSYRVLRGQVYEGVSQVSMGWMLSASARRLKHTDSSPEPPSTGRRKTRRFRESTTPSKQARKKDSKRQTFQTKAGAFQASPARKADSSAVWDKSGQIKLRKR